MLKNIYKNLKRNLLNVQGPTTERKLVVFESDDWGSIRMPSKNVFNSLKKKQLKPGLDSYLKYDTLAGVQDFEALFEKLRSVKDKNNKPAIFTANAVMGNPDFEKISQDKFTKYHWEPFTKTWGRYPHCQGVEKAWEHGQKEQFLRFQCHGREHLNVDQWMKSLQNNDALVKKAFEYQMLSISSQPSHLRFNYMEGLDYFTKEEQENKKKILEESLQFFKSYFGFNSKSFIANCYIWDDFVEKVLAENGVNYLQGITNQIKPSLTNKKHTHQYQRHYLGQKNRLGQYYLVRNAFFEPSLDPSIDWVSDCLNRINIAFRWGKPAIIGSHRLNYIGGIHEENRTKNLEQLELLLKEIVKRWPNVEFKTSDQVIDTIENEF
jgi:hypothetical protein